MLLGIQAGIDRRFRNLPSSGGSDPTIDTVALFEALSLTVAQLESNTETVAEFEAGLAQSELEDEA